ncbi:MAG: V-type ATPase subunit [Anaeromyxobacteraceae bacterium]
MRLDLANARLGARRARLLGREGLLELLARGAGERAPAAVEAALRAALRAEAAEVLRWIEGPRARRLLSAWLSLEEAEAVKAIVRGLVHGERADAILAAAPATPALGAEALRAAVAAPSAEQALGLLAAGGSEVAAAALVALREAPSAHRSLVPVEVAADRAALARARAAARARGEDAGVLAAHLADRVDARNGATLLLLGDAAAGEGALLEGGRRLGAELLARLARAPLAERRAALEACLGLPAAALASPALADLALERAALAPLVRAARARPLSLAVPLAYLALRRAEVRRQALALRARALGLPGDEVLPLLEA